MITCYRVEYSDGYGIFFKKIWNEQGEPISKRPYYGQKDFPKLWERHSANFKEPNEDNLDITKDKKEYFCAFKSLKDLNYWIDKEHLNIMVSMGFKVYKIKCTDYQIGDHQIVYTKQSIISKIDITKEL